MGMCNWVEFLYSYSPPQDMTPRQCKRSRWLSASNYICVIECKFFVHDCKRLAELSASVVSVECADCKKALC
jgi:hypothetical protein